MANRLQIVRGVDIAARAQIGALDRRAAAKHVTGAAIAAQRRRCRRELRGSEHRRDGPGRRHTTARGRQARSRNRAITAGVISGASPSVTITLSRLRRAPRAPQRSDAAWPSSQSAQITGSARSKSTRAQDLVGVRAEHDHDALELVDRALRADRVLEQRPRRQIGEQLRARRRTASRAPAARISPAITPCTSWIRPLAFASRPPSRPCRAATTSARIDSAVSSPLDAPRSRPERRRQALQLLVLEAGAEQPLARAWPAPAASPSRRRTAPASAARSAAPRRRAWGRASAPRSRSPGRSPPSRSNASCGQAAITSSASGKRSRVANRARGSTTYGTPAGVAREPCTASRRCRPRRTGSAAAAGATTSTNIEPRRSEASVHSSSPATRSRLVVELRRAERPRARAVGLDQQLRAGSRALEQRHLGGAAACRRDLGEPRRARRSGPRRRSRRRTAGRRPRPRSRRSRSARSCGSLAVLITRSAISTTAPSTQPPDTPPETSPCSLIAIFVPSGRGAERLDVDDRRQRDAVAALGPVA